MIIIMITMHINQALHVKMEELISKSNTGSLQVFEYYSEHSDPEYMRQYIRDETNPHECSPASIRTQF